MVSSVIVKRNLGKSAVFASAKGFLVGESVDLIEEEEHKWRMYFWWDLDILGDACLLLLLLPAEKIALQLEQEDSSLSLSEHIIYTRMQLIIDRGMEHIGPADHVPLARLTYPSPVQDT